MIAHLNGDERTDTIGSSSIDPLSVSFWDIKPLQTWVTWNNKHLFRAQFQESEIGVGLIWMVLLVSVGFARLCVVSHQLRWGTIHLGWPNLECPPSSPGFVSGWLFCSPSKWVYQKKENKFQDTNTLQAPDYHVYQCPIDQSKWYGQSIRGKEACEHFYNQFSIP